MKLHGNAALSLNRRRVLCLRVLEQGWSLTSAAAAAEVSVRCARKWVGCYRCEGELGLLDRSSVPRRIPHRTSEERVQAIVALRRLRFASPEIAETLGMALSTASGILTRIGMGKLGRLGLEPAQRYERERPGKLIHIDVKKLGRIQGGAGKRVRGGLRPHYNPRLADAAGVPRKTVGWECVHIAIDDATRLAYAEVLPDEKATTAVGFLRRAIEFCRRHGIQIDQLMTDGCRSYVIHEGAGVVKVGVRVRGWLGAGWLTAGRRGAVVRQSSIRSRWADQSVVRCSGAQSSGRPSWVSEAMT